MLVGDRGVSKRLTSEEGEGVICDKCVWAGSVGGYPEGQGTFACECANERIPFDMNEDRCPCFEPIIEVEE